MEDQNGIVNRKTVPIIELGPAEAHVQNEIENYKCKICKEDEQDMVLLRTKDKKMAMACLDHTGVAQEFMRQFKRVPLGWNQTKTGE